MTRRKQVKENEILLSEQQVWDVLTFARTLASNMFPGIITPDLLSQRMKEISYTPSVATEDALNRALADPKNSEEQLRSFIEN